ncbi:MAG TPA: alpha/beta hydrolase [Kofleriaceae bacterium]|jgi:pimeloyl-ACP methyl ester carboxylesterase
MPLTRSDVRLRKRRAGVGPDWFFLPGGPGIGSESLHELGDALDVPGSIWMVDLPGDGSNTVDEPEPYRRWPGVVIEAIERSARPIFVGHSTGGMYLLSVPELERKLAGLVLISSAPDATWRPAFAAMCARHPLPAVAAASAAYAAHRTPATLRALCVASAPWNFGAHAVERGRELLGRMPYNVEACEWSAREFDDSYAARWWPQQLPTLIISGSDDRVVDQSLWDRPQFRGAHVLHRRIAGGAHFPWIEEPAQVAAAFRELAAR